MADEQTGVSETEIAVHWHEEEYYSPPESFIQQANLKDPEIREKFRIENFPDYFAEYGELLQWDRKWDQVFDGSNPPFWRWFVGGRLNASVNCIDRHLASNRNKAAFYFVPENPDEMRQVITYQDLYVRVNEFAALLRDFAGVKKGDRVTIHMPMVAELPIAMLACARLGAIHSVVFGGFSGQACADRIIDSESHILITMDGYYRSGKWLNHKEKADVAVERAEQAGQHVDKVLIFERHPGRYSSDTPLTEGRDFIVNELLSQFRGARVEPESMKAEDPLFLMYTSGSTGKPKGVQHSTGGYLSYVTATSKNILDIHPEDVYWCMADIGWITGHSYIVYGPLSLGASSIIYEGVPSYPHANRPFEIAEELGVNIFHTSPTAIRGLRMAKDINPQKYNYHFKLMVTVGEPIEPDVWRWYYHVIGRDEAVIVDTWWQTETGGFLCSTVPALDKMKPGSAGPGVPGIHPVIFDDEGHEIQAGSGRGGNICIRNPWPGTLQTIWKDPERFVRTYYGKYCKNPDSKDWRDWPYMAGDGAMLASDGYFRILGRIDDVINVAGHRLGTKELESAVLRLDEVAEAAVIAAQDDLKGTVPELYVSLQPNVVPSDELSQRIVNAIVSEIGPIARPRKVWIVPDLPKTRSGKIMRRILASISNNKEIGDVTTLANPEVVDTIHQLVRS
ncbi:acetyl-CoA synthetase [Sulfobacillus thermosulfidooxidans DSM 9293]|uniref:Acetate--CoA ligase n=1 Tax=Sulfobacillus thermosulfidooxidans (strain DSM 9293 / VKM B-1269 / AT-1) TaxID=929705 RepID=A0A1W1WKL6_SULTA|nr:acetate--CoA ligase [Sulfobacillus thermosulfidooxidans]SMC06283.1 acetyl-CoA synthetase [Sulfobacillus thermosulfidooxidans DSM 9293]